MDECTQKIECTQDLYETYSQKICPQEIGFLGICGEKYPIKKGPNKIGRDPNTCNIVLNQQTISKQHAVINVLSSTNFMLMDLDSANKTRISDKILKPYIPHPLNNGDIVHFGDIFGVFRMHQEDEDLPMTQAIDIPETPIHKNPISRIAKAPITMIPESPDVSDRDDSFLASSQQRGNKETNVKSINIHEMETQDLDLIQIPEDLPDPLINSPETAHTKGQVRKISTQHEMQINLFASNKASGNEIFTANTQLYNMETPSVSGTPERGEEKSKSKDKLNSSDEAVIPDEVDTQGFDGPLDIQSKVREEIITSKSSMSKAVIETNEKNINEDQKLPHKRNKRTSSNDLTDCEDMDITNCHNRRPKIISDKPDIGDDDDTDCEGFEISLAKIINREKMHNDNLKDLPTKVIDTDLNVSKSIIDTVSNENVNFEDMPTQVILEDEPMQVIKEDMPTQVIEEDILTQVIGEDVPTQIIGEDAPTQVITEDAPTQVIDEDAPTQVIDEDTPTQVLEKEPVEQYSQEMVGSFRIPSKAPLKSICIDIPKVSPPVQTNQEITTDEDNRYYQSTQEVFNDLCSQEQYSPEIMTNNNSLTNKPDTANQKKDGSGSNSENDAKVNNYVNNLSKQEIRDVVGADSVKKLQRMPSDSSDIETPKGSISNIDIGLPNSQEIKQLVVNNPRRNATHRRPLVISSDSESDNDSDKQMPPVLYRREIKKKKSQKESINQILKADALPSRITTRIRKPSSKVQTSDEKHKKAFTDMLKPKLITDQEIIDDEIININLSSLKTKGQTKKVKDNEKESSNVGDIKSYFPVVDKPGVENKKVKPNGIKETSKTSKSKSNESSKTKVNVKNPNTDVKQNDLNQEAESGRSTRSRRHNKKDSKENEKQESQRSSNKKAETQTKSSKTADKLAKSHEVDNSTSLDSTVDSNKNIRKTRSSTKDKLENKSITPKSATNEKPKRSNRKREKTAPEKDELKLSKEPEIRRSKRQKTVKNANEMSSPEVKPQSSGKKRAYDKSVAYDNSLEACAESPKRVTRQSASTEEPSPKRTRSDMNASHCNIRPVKTQYVLYSDTLYRTEIRNKLEKLGAVTVQDVSRCTVFMTQQVRRSFKLLCAVGLGCPVVGIAWANACFDTKTILDPWSYLLKDVAAEKRYNFDLERTLRGKRNYLNGYRVSSTPKVVPNEKELKRIVECSGGEWGSGGGAARWVCVSCVPDAAAWGALRARGALLVTPEFVLSGVLHQRADVRTHAIQTA